jgi:hypothetical protein
MLSRPSKTSKRAWLKEFLYAKLPKPLALRLFGSSALTARPSEMEMTARLQDILNEENIDHNGVEDVDGFLPEYDEDKSIPPSVLSSGNIGGTIIF